MRNLVRRYVTQEQRKAENEGVTEDDVNEIKNDISAFRFEMIEIMRASGMNTQSASGPSGILCLCWIYLQYRVAEKQIRYLNKRDMPKSMLPKLC